LPITAVAISKPQLSATTSAVRTPGTSLVRKAPMSAGVKCASQYTMPKKQTVHAAAMATNSKIAHPERSPAGPIHSVERLCDAGTFTFLGLLAPPPLAASYSHSIVPGGFDVTS
jgi:hypothetical protein